MSAAVIGGYASDDPSLQEEQTSAGESAPRGLQLLENGEPTSPTRRLQQKRSTRIMSKSALVPKWDRDESLHALKGEREGD
eukprot:scaffold158_cov228-Pinguiococcus_pyrenoidosus.AAC.4